MAVYRHIISIYRILITSRDMT